MKRAPERLASCRSSLIASVLLLAWATHAFAQTGAATAQLTGTVVDATRAIVPGATIRAQSADTGLTREAVADEAGRFVVTALRPGVYRVFINQSGFASYLTTVVLQVGEQVDLEALLQVSFVDTIEVVGAQRVVDYSQRALATVVPGQQLDRLPTNGRNFIAFALLTPGVTSDRTPAQAAVATSGLTFSGQPGRYNNVSVDGLDNNELVTGSVRDTFSQDAVQEFQVLANGYSAEFGKASGGVINIVTRSGTNTLAGTTFAYGRDDALNGRQYFERFTPAGQAIDLEKSPLRQWQFGGTLGGPLVRNRSFYFASFERLDQQAANLVTIDASAAALLTQRGYLVETGNVPFVRRANQGLGKVDHDLGRGRALGARITAATRFDENSEPWGGLVARSGGAVLDSTEVTTAGSLTDSASSAWLHELRGQHSYRRQDILSLDPTCGGPCLFEDQGSPQIEIPGVAIAGRHRFTPSLRTTQRLQVVDTVTRVAAEHRLKAGVDYGYTNFVSQRLPLLIAGRYLFPGLAAFTQDSPGLYAQAYGDSTNPFGYHDLSLFVQDEWRASQRVTVNLGVRYQAQFLPPLDTNVPGLGVAGLLPDRDNVAPRLSVSWDPRGDGRTQVRGAYGVYYGNEIVAMSGVAGVVGDDDGVRVRIVAGPGAAAAWRLPGRRAPEPVGVYPRLTIAIDPDHETPFTHQAVAGIDRELPGRLLVSGSVVYARGFNYPGTLDYNPLVAELGANRRPLDTIDPATGQRVPGSSAGVIQFTPYGQTWYKALSVTLTRRAGRGHHASIVYTLSKAEDIVRDHQDAVPQSQGRGRNAADPLGLPLGFDPLLEKTRSHQDQRHRFVAAGTYQAPWGVQLASIVTIGSGRPFNILAGLDLNRDGDAGIPSQDRARRDPADPASSVARNAGMLPAQATVDARISRRFGFGRAGLEVMLEAFNLLNRVNFTEINNVFGAGAFPQAPLPSYGQFTQTGPARQLQLAARVRF